MQIRPGTGELSPQLVQKAREAAQMGRVDRRDYQKLLTEAARDGQINETEKKFLASLDNEANIAALAASDFDPNNFAFEFTSGDEALTLEGQATDLSRDLDQALHDRFAMEGLDTDRLSAAEKAAADIDRDGKLSAEEETALFQVADANGDGSISRSEKEQLSRLLSSGPAGHAFLESHLKERAQAVKQGIQTQLGPATQARETAQRRLEEKGVPLPTRLPRELHQERNRLGDVEPLRQERQQKSVQLRDIPGRKRELEGQVSASRAAIERLRQSESTRSMILENYPANIELMEKQLRANPDDQALRQRLDEVKGKLAEARQQQSELETARQTVASAGRELGQLQQLERQLPREIEALDRRIGQAEALDLQIGFAEAAAKETSLLRLEAAASRLEDSATRHEAGADSSRRQITQANERLRSIEATAAEPQSGSMKSLLENRANALKIKEMVEKGELDASYVDMDKVEQTLRESDAVISRWQSQLEGQAQQLIRQMDDPTFRQALEHLPPGEKAEVMGRIGKVLAQSQAGRAYIENRIVPTLTNPAQGDPLWKDIFGKGKDSYEAGLAVLESIGGILANRANGAQLVETAMRTTLGLGNASALQQVRDIVARVDRGEMTQDAAKELLEKSNLTQVAQNLDKVGKALVVMDFGLKVYDLMQEPSVKTALEAGKSATEVSKIIFDLIKDNPKYADFAKLAGKAAGVAGAALEGILSAIAMRGEGGTVERGDMGGTAGHSLIAAGAIVTATGIVLDGTVAGAVAGVPLNVIGVLMIAAGKVTNWVSEDSSGEQWVKKNAPEYYKG